MSAKETAHELARRAREATGLSQMAFGRLLGVSTATVSAWEQERRRPTPRRMAHALLRLIAIRPEWCVEELGPVTERARGKKPRLGRLEAEVLARCRALAYGPASRIPLDLLRAAMETAERGLVDQALLGLEQAGRIELSPPLFPDHLSDRERQALLNHPDKGLVLFVYRQAT